MKLFCDKNICYFCGVKGVEETSCRNLIEIHHIIERADGGSNEAFNLIACCSTCHSRIHLNIIQIDKWYDFGYTMKLKWKYQDKERFGSQSKLD